jgi:ATP-binding protein involved in chromosome partitioning
VDLGFVKNIAVEGSSVPFELELTTPACPVKAEFEKAARERVLRRDGISDVRVSITSNTRGRAKVAGEPAGDALPGIAEKIARKLAVLAETAPKIAEG